MSSIPGNERDGEVALDEHVAAGRVDALGLLVEHRQRGEVGDGAGVEVDAHGLAAAVEVGREDGNSVVGVGVAVGERAGSPGPRPAGVMDGDVVLVEHDVAGRRSTACRRRP